MGNVGKDNRRYLGDANPGRKKHVHDLLNQKTGCAVHAIRWADHGVPYRSYEEARRAGYLPCLFCMPYEKDAS